MISWSKYHLPVLFVACLLIRSPAGAVDLNSGKLSVTLTYRSMYDNNVLRYSVRDRNRFLDDTEPYRSSIRSLDDIRSDFKLSASYSFKPWFERKTLLSATGDFAQHLMNPIKNFGWISLTVNQELTKSLSVNVNYFYDIDYYIRVYKDVHTDTRQHCSFSMDQWTGRANYRPIKTFEFEGFVRFKKYAYNKYFTEYDSDYIETGGEVIYRSGPWRLSGGYSLADNDNVGFNELYLSHDYFNIEDSEEGQSDYQQDTYEASLRYAFRLAGNRSRVLLETSLKDRYYATELDIQDDPMHSGRRDVMVSFELSGKIDINREVAIEIGSAYANRRSRSPNYTVQQIKNYDQTYGWVELSYELW